MTVADMIKAARSRVRNLTVEEVAAALENPRVLVIDVREPAEIAAEGMIPGALAVPRGMLEFHADPVSPITSRS